MQVVVVTGSRADIGPLTPVIKALDAEVLRLGAYNANTSAETAFGCGRAAIDTARANIDKADFAVVLGDRWEILGAASAINLKRIPLVHLSGGDVTEGSQDDCMRHAITKLAHIHFPTNADSHRRILTMGEESWRVHTVGCPGIDQLLQVKTLTKDQVLNKFGIQGDYVLVSYQPETLEPEPVDDALRLVEALYGLQLPCIFTTPNPDLASAEIQSVFERFCNRGRGFILEMAQGLYLSVMKHCKIMIGNSSSGLYEAPTFKVPFVNVGWRQAGRLVPKNVKSVPCEPAAITWAVKELLRRDLSDTVNPYGDGKAAEKINDFLTNKFNHMPRQRLLTKKWVSHGVQSGVGRDSSSQRLGEVS